MTAAEYKSPFEVTSLTAAMWSIVMKNGPFYLIFKLVSGLCCDVYQDDFLDFPCGPRLFSGLWKWWVDWNFSNMGSCVEGVGFLLF